MAATSTSFEPRVRHDPFDISTDHANGDVNEHNGESDISRPTDTVRPRIPRAYDLPGISLRAFLLGLTFGVSTTITLFLAYSTYPVWRLPFFLSSLSLFHFLEYQITAQYNPTHATVSAFLLSQNGKAYNIAHGLAFLECFVRCVFFRMHALGLHNSIFASSMVHAMWLALGFGMLLVGQATRTAAMAQAGSNFNHHVQMEKKQGHVLVTDGVYSWFRHPSYFGFFWWGLGTQVVLGNVVCLVGYAMALRRFFRHRIFGMIFLDLEPDAELSKASS